MRIKILKPSGNIIGNKALKNDKCKNNFEVEKFIRKNSVIWNRKDSDSVHVDMNHTHSSINWNHKY